MINDEFGTVMMSESLQDRLPELEDQLSSSINSFVIFALIAETSENNRIVLAGTVVGVAFEDRSVKVDMRVSIDQAYDFITTHATTPWHCVEYHLQLGEKDYARNEEFSISSPRMVDIDRLSRECTLGFDLIKLDNL